MENTLKYLNVGKSKDDASKNEFSKVPNVEGQSIDKAKDSLNAKSLKPVVIGSGKKVKSQSVDADTKTLPNSKVLLVTDGDLTMPDMKGWTKEDILAFQELTNIKVKTTGSGFVSKQSVTQGQKLKKSDNIEVTLSAESTDGTTDESSKQSLDKSSDKKDKSKKKDSSSS